MTKKTPKIPLTNKPKRGILRAGDALSLNKVFGAMKVALRDLRKDRICWNRRMVRPFRNCFFESDMIKEIKMKKTVWKIIASLALVVGIAALSACGGGGGGGSTTPVTPPPVVTGSVAVIGCGTVADGASTTNCTVTWATSNATAPKLTVGGALVSSLASGTGSFSVSLGSTTFAIADNTTVLASATAAANCGGASAPVAGVCQKTVLHYTDVALANTDQNGWYPYKLTLTAGSVTGTVTFLAEKAINATSFQAGVYPLANCIYNKVKLATGAIKLNCQDAVSLTRHSLVWNPITNRVTEYDNSEGAYPVTSDATWVDAQTDTPPFVGWDSFAEISAGWLHNTTTNGSEVHFKRKSDTVDVILPINIGRIKAFCAFSN